MDKSVIKASNNFYNNIYDSIKQTIPAKELQTYTFINEYKLRCLIQLGYLSSIKNDQIDAAKKFKEAYSSSLDLLKYYRDRCQRFIRLEDENTYFMNLHFVEKVSELRYVSGN